MHPSFITPNVRMVDRGTFFVRSSSCTKEYLVDILAYGGAGQCNCPDYQCRHEPKMAAVQPGQWLVAFRCRHIKAVREFVADMAISGMMKPDEAIPRPS